MSRRYVIQPFLEFTVEQFDLTSSLLTLLAAYLKLIPRAPISPQPTSAICNDKRLRLCGDIGIRYLYNVVLPVSHTLLPSRSVIVDDQDSLVQYFPPVGWASQGGSPQYRSTIKTSVTAGDTATFTFNGTSVAVYGTVGTGIGATMAFRVDQSAEAVYAAPDADSAGFTTKFFGRPQNIFQDYFMYNITSTSGKTLFVVDNDARVEYSPACWSVVKLDGPRLSQHKTCQPGSGVLAFSHFRSNQLFSFALAAGNHIMIITLLDDHPFNIDYFLFKSELRYSNVNHTLHAHIASHDEHDFPNSEHFYISISVPIPTDS
ncbi:hypothetical protein DFH09DRAFT_1309330 [Mycena vulgaris]|nr:hypothetical protein DFH09DRAFT_1309330 [Mycena vulgaris]